MGCEVVQTPHGAAIFCGRGSRAPKCQFGDGKASVALCDFKDAHGRTCDARMCGAHRTRVGPNVDYCPNHKKDAPVQEQLL